MMMVSATEILHDPAILELLPTAVYVIDENGLIRGFNSKASKLWGRSPQFLSSDREREQWLVAAAIKTGMSFSNEEVVIPRPDGTQVTVLANISPLCDEAGKTVGAINSFQDITEQNDVRIMIEKQRVQHLASELEEKVQTQKVTDTREGVLRERNITIGNLEDERDLREKFVGTLTHDLRTPMTAIKMTAQLLMRRSGDPSSVINACKRIVVNTDRADRMIRDLLDVNRLKVGESIPLSLEDCRLDRLLQTIHEELVILHGGRFHIDRDLPRLRGEWDSEGIRRMVENLAGNAIKYGASDSPVTIGLSGGGDWAEIKVHNSGKPISPEDQLTLFKAYKRTASAKSGGQKGWGIGLTVVDGIAKAHGGSAWVVSDEAHGTCFYIRLPINCKVHPK